MADAEKHKRAAILELVCQVLSSEGISSSSSGSVEIPDKYEDLRDGVAFYYIFSCIAPSSFPDVKEIIEQTAANRQNRILRKGNLITLLRHLDEYAHLDLGAPDTWNLSALLSASDIANPPAVCADAADTEAHDRGLLQLTELSDIFIVAVVLSGHEGIMRVVKKLSHADQVVLSNAAKACIIKHALRPRRRHEAPAPETSHQIGVQRRQSLSSESRRSIIPSPVDEPSNYNYAALQLRRELDDSVSRVAELDAKLQLALTEGQEWESKYKQLLDESEQRRAAFADEGHLRQLLAKRDEVIRTLTTAVSENAKQMSAFREVIAAQEIALAEMKRKLKRTEEELVKKSCERREALGRLTVAEDRLAVQVEARTKLENEIENLRSELALAQISQHARANDDPITHSGGSVESVGSVGRIVQLENELDEVRSQKDAAERLLHVLQRQVASLPSAEEPKPLGEAEVLKAQLRQAEREKEKLRNQLSETIARLEEAQTACVPHAGSACVVNSETERNSLTVTATPDVCGSPDASVGSPADVLGRQQERCIMASTLILLGYRNLMIQQRAMLEHWTSYAMRDDVREENLRGFSAGSFLTRHRREVEEGLLETAIGRRR